MARTVLQTKSGDKIVVFYGRSGRQIVPDLRWLKKESKTWGSPLRTSFPKDYSARFESGSRGLGKRVDGEGNNVFYFGVLILKKMLCSEANGIAKELIQTFCARSGLNASLKEAVDLLEQSPIEFIEPDPEEEE